MDEEEARYPKSRPGEFQEGEPTGRSDGCIEDGHPVISTGRARQGIKTGAMRYVLGVSLALIIVVFAVAYLLTVIFPH
ncbi:MAG: hypothetical protein ACREDY_17075 [Bradyrhizobium sp.]